MRDDSPRHLRHTSSALFTDAATGKNVSITMECYSDDTAAWAVVRRSDGTINTFDMSTTDMIWWRDFLFPSAPVGVRPPTPPTVPLVVVPDLSEGRAMVRLKRRTRRQRTESLAAD